ncbi:hypothetical protein SteCoe_12342 [Stentor coeruleus]|uniref:DOMON domain-containing protein n=1 Tax=Stentor coeruleus TaxID=5963 RepID=A0A1R2CB34_9CILI|nr:hypothetical protein SteCoe_12342 [Stentor coeruleus]
MILVLLLFQTAISLDPCFTTTFRSGMKFEFNNRNDNVHFTLHVPKLIFEPYEWAGIGIKRIEDGVGMENADIISFIFKEYIIEDRWATENGFPPADEDQGGTLDADIGPTKGIISLETKVLSWDRPLDTKDNFDTKLEYGRRYYLMWAYGMLEGGDIGYHEDRDYEEFEMVECANSVVTA